MYDENATKTGGPAFPFVQEQAAGGGGGTLIYHGMTLRDYFAARVMEKMISLSTDNDNAARRCYQLADAMLRARTTINK